MSDWARSGREPWYFSIARKIYGWINYDEMLIPNGGGSGGVGQFDPTLDRIENFSNALDQSGLYHEAGKAIDYNYLNDTSLPHDNWRWYTVGERFVPTKN